MPGSRPAALTAPAILLIVVGALNFLLSAGYLALGLYQLAGGSLRRDVAATDTAGTAGYLLGTIFPILSLVAAVVIVMGCVQVLRGRNRRFGMAGAVAAIVPCTSCLFLFGIPFGIWLLVVLGRPEIKEYFRTGRLPEPAVRPMY